MQSTMQHFAVILFCIVLLNVNLQIEAQTLPGAKIQLSQSGLNYAAGIAVNLLSRNIHNQRLPDQSGSKRVIVGNVEYSVTNMRIEGFDKPSTSVVVNPGSGLTWTMNNAGISVHGNWRYQYKKWIVKIRDSGTFTLRVSGATASVSIAINKDAAGRPAIQFLHCHCSISNVNVRFRGGASWLYNLFSGAIERPVKSALERAVCTAAQKTISTNAAQQMATLKTSVTLERRFVLDYQLVENVLFSHGFIQSAHKGEVFHVSDRSEAPFLPRPIQTSAPQRMVTAYISEYVMNTLGYVLHKHNVLWYVLDKNDEALNGDGAFFAVSNCTGFCFGTLFPELADRYPNSFVEITMATAEPPTLQISSTSVTGTFKGRFDIAARSPNNAVETLLSLRVTCTLVLSPGIRDNFITAVVTRFTPSIAVTSSLFGDIDIPTEKLDRILMHAANAFIVPKLNEIGQKGVEIPNVEKVQFVGPSLRLVDGAVVVSTDLCYTP